MSRIRVDNSSLISSYWEPEGRETALWTLGWCSRRAGQCLPAAVLRNHSIGLAGPKKQHPQTSSLDFLLAWLFPCLRPAAVPWVAFAVLVNQRIREMKDSPLPLPQSLSGHRECRSHCVTERSEQEGVSEVLRARFPFTLQKWGLSLVMMRHRSQGLISCCHPRELCFQPGIKPSEYFCTEFV